jgi:hypothetical protein
MRHEITAAQGRRVLDTSVPPHQGRGAGESSGIYIGLKSSVDRILLRHC